ncbi:MAG: septum formation initiator family protein [bacterium]
MRNFKKKTGFARIMQSKPVLIFLGIVVLVFAANLVSFLGKLKETARNKEIAQEKIAELEKQKDQLSVEISKLKTDEGVEESIREKFGLVKDGEGMIVVVDDKAVPAESQTADTSKFWTFVKNWFK